MHKGKVLSLSAAALGVALTGGLTSVFAAEDGITTDKQESRAQLEQWKAEHEDRIDALLEEGDIEGLREELNNKPERPGKAFGKKGKHGGFAKGMGHFDSERREAMDAAIEGNDYETWSQLVEEQLQDMRDRLLSEDHFNTLVEINEARDAGDEDRARELHQQLRDAAQQ